MVTRLESEGKLGELALMIDRELRSFFDRLPAASFYDIMRYQLGWKDELLNDSQAWAGKRIRPALCLLTCAATANDYTPALPAAMAIELLHNFTLIHDDIEDGDHLRRNRPAVWKLWGVAQALNVGDGMHVLAKRALLEHAQDKPELPVLLQLAADIDETCLQLCEGQHLDLHYQDVWDVSVQEYMTVITGKCAALIGYATYAGAALGGAAPEVRDQYRAFGRFIGLAFQIRDDILAIWGDQSLTGKPCADLSKRKKTLPLIYAREQAGPSSSRRLKAALEGESLTETDLADIYSVLEETGARQWTIKEATSYREMALTALEATGISNRAQDGLRELAGFSIDRAF